MHGDRGSAVIDNDILTFIHTTPAGSETQQKPFGVVDDRLNQVDLYPNATRPATGAARDPGELSDAHLLQYLNFLAALRGEEVLRVTLETHRQSISLIEGVYASARAGRPVAIS